MLRMRSRSLCSAPEGAAFLDLHVPARLSEVSQVRRALAGLPLRGRALDDVRLLTTELVTNSIRHAGLRPRDTIRVQASLSGSRVRVDVSNRDRRSPPDAVAGAIRPNPGAASGWGLYLVECIASRWGRTRGRYWFEIELGAALDRGVA